MEVTELLCTAHTHSAHDSPLVRRTEVATSLHALPCHALLLTACPLLTPTPCPLLTDGMPSSHSTQCPLLTDGMRTGLPAAGYRLRCEPDAEASVYLGGMTTRCYPSYPMGPYPSRPTGPHPHTP
jgi:hypothetical protein